jgi:hypothetical protein
LDAKIRRKSVPSDSDVTRKDRWEKEKRERRRLRARQRSLRKQFLRSASSLTIDEWSILSKDFLSTLREDKRLEYTSVDTDRYLLSIVNLLLATGFKVHTGEIPRVSGVHRDYDYSIYAYDAHRFVIVGNSPETLYANLADIQPLCPLPVLGLLYNRSVPLEKPKYDWNFTAESIMRSRRLASALALGYVTISMPDLRVALSTNPFTNPARLRRLADKLGLLRFFTPPVDALPLYGQFVSRSNELEYNMKEFVSAADRTEKAGSQIGSGDITQATPSEAIGDPDYYFKELERARLLRMGKGGNIDQTQKGYNYVRSSILPFPLGQLLHFTCFAARQEVRRSVQNGFIQAVACKQAGQVRLPVPLFIPVDDFDSFSRINSVPAHAVTDSIPVSMAEKYIKELIHSVLGDPFTLSDWGGEQNDIYTSRVEYQGRRLLAAFLLKGPAVKGRLTIAKCGKNGDQIQRLFQSSADVFFIQFNGEVDQRVFEEARQKTMGLRHMGRTDAAFCIIDGLDTARFLKAFQKGQKRR